MNQGEIQGRMKVARIMYFEPWDWIIGVGTYADKLIKKTNQAVSTAKDSMQELTSSMREIALASEETSKIIKTIDEIAFQTNLLAMPRLKRIGPEKRAPALRLWAMRSEIWRRELRMRRKTRPV
jgi:hypothetical protein